MMKKVDVKALAPNTPIIVGVGFCQKKTDDPLGCPEAYKMMVESIRDAADDAGAPSLVEMIESIGVQKGTWKYSNPGKLIADELGCPNAKSILSDLGVLQIMPLFELCQSIADGKEQVGVVVGGESRYRELRSMITGQQVFDTEQGEDTPAPDIVYDIPDPFSSELEDQRGVWAPGEFYAIAESANRHYLGLGIEEHREVISELYSGFSEVAAENPHAWNRDVLSAEEIRTPAAKNAMISFPYTKKLVSQWNVNQSVAILVCSAEKALELNLDSSGFIYPVSATQSRNVVNLAQKKTLHSHPGIVMTGERALELANVSVKDISVAEIYSCFPSSIQISKRDLKLEDDCPITVTGSMAYAGGPMNHAALDSVARMVEVLRTQSAENDDRQIGLVTSLSGMFGKQGCGLYSNVPSETGYDFDDITAAVKAVEIPIPIDADYVGPATIVAYSVMYNKADISHAVAYCDTPNGTRTVVRTNDVSLAEKMTQDEFVGKEITVLSDGDFSV